MKKTFVLSLVVLAVFVLGSVGIAKEGAKTIPDKDAKEIAEYILKTFK